MKLTRERLVWLIALLALPAGGWWLSANTEWVEQDSQHAARGEALENPVYAFEQLLRRLQMQVKQVESLDPQPPEHARLLLLSSDWALMPERAERLHQWVLRGGHLVLPQGTDWNDTDLEEWVPVTAVKVQPARPAASAASASAASAAGEAGEAGEAASAASAAVPAKVAPVSKIWELLALDSSPPLWGDTPTLATCEIFPTQRKLQLAPKHAASWSLNGDHKVQVLRLPIGQGSVTVLNADSTAFHNTAALRCDNLLLMASAVQAEPGSTAWIYLNETRQALLPWLWQQGWVALVAALLTLAAALWRGAVRFGPRLASPPRLRRSISEQVRGLGAYLHREGREALLAAQQRALDRSAQRSLPGYGRLSLPERASAIAQATQLPLDELLSAMNARSCSRAELPQQLQWLESARRQLLSITNQRHSERPSP